MVVVKKEETVVQETVADIVCNKCGNSMFDAGFVVGCNISTTFTYGSNKDGTMHYFHICDDCYDEFTNTFVHKPEYKEGSVW